jgi:hypothetical protein
LENLVPHIELREATRRSRPAVYKLLQEESIEDATLDLPSNAMLSAPGNRPLEHNDKTSADKLEVLRCMKNVVDPAY